MRTKILVVSAALLLSANLRAQVSIGELAEPTAGAILDLNKAVKGGLALSVVDLPNFQTIPNGFPGIASQADVTPAVKSGFRGALVYNTGVTSPPAGIYVWNGSNWTPPTDNCLPAENLTLTGLPFAKAGDDVTFLISTGASDFCSQGETYKWYLSGVNNSTYTPVLNETAPSLTTSFATVGTYKVKVEVTNRYTVAPLVKEMSVEITADGAPPATLIDGQYAVNGDFCYDVKGPKPSSQTQAFYDSRTDAFADGAFTKIYTFTHTSDFSNLTVLNPGGIVASVSKPAATFSSGNGSVTFEVTFASDVKTRVIAAGAPVYVQLLVSYKNNGGDDKVAYKILKVQDGDCECPVQVPTSIHPSGWLTFQCHNLGADYDIRSDADLMNINATNFREYHGDWYKFGAPTASLENTPANDSYSNSAEWGAKTYQNDDHDWLSSANPCPAGWRLPTKTEWAAVASYNTGNLKSFVNGVENNTWAVNNINNVLKIGDYLYLPAPGIRDNMSGSSLSQGTTGSYWSSTGNGSTGAYPMTIGSSSASIANSINRRYAVSVRCVSAE